MHEGLVAARTRFMTNLRDPVMREKVAMLFIGKALGLTLALGFIVFVMPSVAHAQDIDPAEMAQINAINTVWMLIAAFLVFCMQVGFVMLEAGFARSRESSTSWWSASSTRHLRHPVLGLRLRLHVRAPATASSARLASS